MAVNWEGREIGRRGCGRDLYQCGPIDDNERDFDDRESGRRQSGWRTRAFPFSVIVRKYSLIQERTTETGGTGRDGSNN